MNWLKNTFSKFFKEDDDEYEQQQFEDDEQEEYEEVTTKKSTFRFPLIDDAELAPPTPKKESRVQQHTLPEDERPLELPTHLQQNEAHVFDVETQGIRDLLASRQKRTGRSRVLPNVKKHRSLEVTKEEKKYLTADPIREEKQVNREFINPLENKKKFVPTDVPSPVYGFKKTKPIEELLAEKRPDLEGADLSEKPVAEQEDVLKVVQFDKVVELPRTSEENVEEVVSTVEQEISQVEPPIEEQEPLETVENVPVIVEQEPVTEQVEPEPLEDTLSDLQVQHVTFENSTIHIGQLNVEQVPPVVEMQQEQLAADFEIPEKPTGSRLPFNVLMLQSDKEKLKIQDMLQEQFIKKKPEMKMPTPDVNVSNGQVDAMAEPQETAQVAVAVLEREEMEQADDLQVEQAVETIVDEPVVESIPVATVEEVEPSPPQIEIVQEPAHEVEELPASTTTVTTAPVEQLEDTPKFSRQYEKPSMSFLVPPEEQTEDFAWMDEQGERLITALSHFHIEAEIVSIIQGPAVTQFEITVAHGTKVSKVRGLADDIKLALAARDIRIDAPIPGKHSIGIEIPNRMSRAVRLSEVTNSENFQQSDSPLEAALGLDLTGTPVTIDLRKMPHGLIAGATGSGKSVCINSILVSLLYKADPHELKLMLIDPKMVELAPFNHIPHLVSPVITDVKAATAALKWAVEEMERRYQLFMHAGVRDLTRFNEQAEKAGQHGHKLPYILIVIDELADLMMMSPADVEEAICRIAQKARACGIHLIVATQRPSVDVITGLIKSNIPTRIAFAVSSAVDSRTILDMQGAERLLGRGDMLYLGNGMPAPIRLQGTFVTDDEIEEIIAYVRTQGEPEYFFQHDELLKKAEISDEQDELFEEVCRYVFEAGTASTSSIQRRYKIGYNRAARLIDMLESHGFVSEQRGSKPREVFITESDIISLFE